MSATKVVGQIFNTSRNASSEVKLIWFLKRGGEQRKTSQTLLLTTRYGLAQGLSCSKPFCRALSLRDVQRNIGKKGLLVQTFSFGIVANDYHGKSSGKPWNGQVLFHCVNVCQSCLTFHLCSVPNNYRVPRNSLWIMLF